MKKNAFMISAFAFLLTGSLAFSFGGKAPETESFTGHINYYGNAPFATPAFEADDGKIYLMEVDETTDHNIEEILALQGSHLELKGTLETESADAAFPVSQSGTIVISDYKLLK